MMASCPARIDQARIAGLEPTVGGHGRARRILLLVVAQEHAWTLHLHLAALADAHIDARQRAPDGIRVGGIIGLRGDQRAGLGRAVDLFQIHAKGAEKAERIRSQRRTAGQAPARIAQAELIAHRTVDEDLAETAGGAQRGRHGLAIALQQFAPLRGGTEILVDPPLEAAKRR